MWLRCGKLNEILSGIMCKMCECKCSFGEMCDGRWWFDMKLGEND